MSAGPRKRREARAYGLDSEALAVLALRFKGWRILARGWLAKGGELDIVAARGDVIAFVEVKARATHDLAREAVTAEKRRRLSRAARDWILANPWAATRTLRGDLVTVAPMRWPRHHPAAVELDLGHL